MLTAADPFVTFTGDGITKEFSFDKPVFDGTTLKVYTFDADEDDAPVLVSTSDYTVAVEADFSGATVTFDTAPASGVKVGILRSVPFSQTVDISDTEDVPPSTLEKMVDRLAMMVQHLSARIDKTILGDVFGFSGYSAGSQKITDVADGAADTDAATVGQIAPYAAAAETAQGLAEDARDAAIIAKEAAETAETNAETAETNAETAETNAETAQGLAEDARDAAVLAKEAAELAETNAETAETNAETAQGFAEAAQTAAETAQGLAEAAQTAAETAQGLAEAAQTAAETAQTNAETAETGAETAQGLAEDARDAALLAQQAAESAAGTLDPVGTQIADATTVATPADTDLFGFADVSDSNTLKKLTWANIKSAIQAALNGVYAAVGTTLTAGNGLTGGGDLSANRSFAVGAGTGISVAADAVSLDFGIVDPTAAALVSTTINCDVNNGATLFFTHTMGGNRTLATPTNMPDGATIYVRIVSSSDTLSFASGYVGADGDLPDVTDGDNLLVIVRDGSDYIVLLAASGIS